MLTDPYRMYIVVRRGAFDSVDDGGRMAGLAAALHGLCVQDELVLRVRQARGAVVGGDPPRGIFEGDLVAAGVAALGDRLGVRLPRVLLVDQVVEPADTRRSERRAFAAWEFDSPLGHLGSDGRVRKSA